MGPFIIEFDEFPPELLTEIETLSSPAEQRRKWDKPVSPIDLKVNLDAADVYVGEYPEVPYGERNDTAFKVAAMLKDMGLSDTEVLDRMLKWNDEKCKPPLDTNEIETTTKSAYAKGNPAGVRAIVDPLDEFDTVDIPLEEGSGPAPKGDFDDDPADLWADESFPPDLPPGLLPPVLDKFVTDESERKGVERGAVAVAALVVCAAAAPAGFQIQIKQHDTGHTDHAIQWGALVGPPATRKTPVLNEVIRPLKAIEDRRIAEDQPKLRAYERLLDQWKKAGRKSHEPEPERPRLRRKIVKDTTTEALGPILKDNPDGVLAAYDELAAWIGNMDVYRPGKAASKDGPFWLEAKQGGAYTVDRLSRGSLHVPRAAVHILGGIQPDVIRKFAPDFSGNGMLQRFLLVNMRPSASDLDRAPDQKAGEAFHDVVNALAELHDSDFVEPFRFTPEADAHRQAVVAFRNRLLNDPDTPAAFQGWIGKLEAEWGRLSLILHLVKWAADFLAADFPEEVISAETAEQAARLLLEWQYHHQRYFYQSIAGHGAAVNAHALNVAGYILAHSLTAISEREINRNCSGLKTARKHQARLAAMRILELNGWIRVTGYRGKEPNKWTVNPAVHDERFKERAEAERKKRDDARQKIAEAAAARRTAKGGDTNDKEPDREAA